jgi:sulfite exporter TauE/SafE
MTAAQSGAPLRGGLILAAFGAGTLPALLFFGGAAQWLSARARAWMLRGAGLVVAFMGLYNLIRHLRILSIL